MQVSILNRENLFVKKKLLIFMNSERFDYKGKLPDIALNVIFKKNAFFSVGLKFN